MKKGWLLFLTGIIYCNCISAQFSRYIIQLKDKNNSSFSLADPSKFLSQHAIDRRTRYNIAITTTDLPVNAAYIDAIQKTGDVTILNVSKWFNQVAIRTTDAAAIVAINTLPFVQNSKAVAPRPARINKDDKFPQAESQGAKPIARPANPTDVYNYGQAYSQIHLHNAEFLHNHGFNGQDMRLAIMDAGFQNYLTLPTFDSVRNNNQVTDTWDFVANKSNVNGDHPHGMNCFSTIAANMPGTFVGTAPKANFYLFRTEDAATEYPIELQNFAAAAERADSAGVDVFSVSLGYNLFDDASFNFTYADMNGNTTFIARAVDMAAQKGIAVVVAAGNDGNNNWHYIATPGDADSALTIGAVNSSRQIASFSSYGPSSDGQIKPDVAAVGAGAVVASVSSGLPTFGNGTSFACPIMAGITTCLWQAFPEVNNMEIIDALHRSADRFANPDDRTGYGIPDVKKAFVNLQKKSFISQVMVENNCTVSFAWCVKTAADMSCVLERKLPDETTYKAVDSQVISSVFSKQNFSYADDLSAISAGTALTYRFKMNIASDTSFYLDSVTVNSQQSCNTSQEGIIISPNPVSDQLSVKIVRSSAAKVDLVLINALGQQVYQSGYQAQAGQQTYYIPVKQLSNGVYHISVFINGKMEKAKSLIKE